FTPNPEHAEAFTSSGEQTGGKIKQVYLNVRSPLDLTDGVNGLVLDEFEELGISPNWLINFDWEYFDDDMGKEFVDAVKTLGYDGVIFNDINPDTLDEMETWAVFDPSQIRIIK